MNERTKPNPPQARDVTLEQLRDFIVMHALTWNFEGRLSDHPFWKEVERTLQKPNSAGH